MKNKSLLASATAAVIVLSSFLFAPVRQVAASVAYSGMAIVNSVINSTPIGQTTAAAGNFTALGASSISATSIVSNYGQVNGQPGSYAGDNGFVSYGKNSTGDMDFVAANGGASPSFYWYFLLGSTPTLEMYLDQGANLHVPNGNVTAAIVTATTNIKNPVSTVASLPSATSAGPGGQAVVSDGNGTIGACTGGGSTYMIAISNGSAWQCR